MITDQKMQKRLVFKIFLLVAFMLSCNEESKNVKEYAIEYKVGILGAPSFPDGE